MKKLLFSLIMIVTISGVFNSTQAGNIPQATSYGAFAKFGKDLSLVGSIRQPMGPNALDLYLDFLSFPDWLGIGGQYYFFSEDIFPIREGKIFAQYGPGLGIGYAPNYLDIAFEPGAGIIYYAQKKPLEIFFNLILNIEAQFFGDDHYSRDPNRINRREDHFDIDFHPTLQLGMRYAF